jgi:hypothetical protein
VVSYLRLDSPRNAWITRFHPRPQRAPVRDRAKKIFRDSVVDSMHAIISGRASLNTLTAGTAENPHRGRIPDISYARI